MKTYSLFKDNVLHAFEIDNSYLNPKIIAKFLVNRPGISNIRAHKLEDRDDRLEFDFRGIRYIVSEPFGDNSRYWIGPQNPSLTMMETRELESFFVSFNPPIYRKILFYVLYVIIFLNLAHLILKLFTYFLFDSSWVR